MLLLITAKDEEPIGLTKLVSHHQIANLSKALGSNWRRLGSLLGIAEQKLENISTTNKLEHNKGKEMLYEWKKTIDGAAMKELQEKLKKMGMSHLLKLYEGTLSYDTEGIAVLGFWDSRGVLSYSIAMKRYRSNT